MINEDLTPVTSKRRVHIKIGVALATVAIIMAGVFAISSAKTSTSHGSASAVSVSPKALGTGTLNALHVASIAGDSTGPHKGWIDVESFSWGIAHPTTTGASAGKITFNPFSITRKIDNASPALFQACAGWTNLGTVQLAVDVPGPDVTTTVEVFTFYNTRVTNCAQASDGGNGAPMESLSLNFTKITYEYKEQGASVPRHFGWDLATAKKV